MATRRPSIDRARLEQHRRELEASLCKGSLIDYVARGWHVLEPNGKPFVRNMGTDAIVEHLQAVRDGHIRRLAIAVSPGFGKTTLCSVAYPSWRWTDNPARRFLCASHAYKLANNIAGKFMRVVTSDWYRSRFPEVEIRSDALDAIQTERSGVRYAVGVEGAMTGFRTDEGIIDDSLNAIDATSKLVVGKVNDWFDLALSTRFDDAENAPVIVIQQCLAENDLIAHCRELGYEMLVLPARFEANRRCVTSIWRDTRTEEGQILAPEIHSAQFLDEQLRVLRAQGFAAQYQQRPAPAEGNRFKVGMWSWCSLGTDVVSPLRPHGAKTEPPYVVPRRANGSLDLDVLCVTVDATGGSTAHDASALGCLVYARKGQRRFVLHDADKGPRTFLQTVDDIKETLRKAIRLAGPQPNIVVLVEKKALGQAAIEKIVQAIHDGTLVDDDGNRIRAKVKGFEPTGRGDKTQRSASMEPDIDAGLIHLLDGASWVPAFVEEFALDPNGARNDRIDALSQAELEFAESSDVERARKLLGMASALRGFVR